MVLDSLSRSLRETLRKISRSSSIDESLINEVVREIQRALILADVDINLTIDITNKVEQRGKNEPVPKNSNPRNHLITIVYEELLRVLGKPREFKIKPATIMLVGLYGQGKTTSAGKLARFYLRHGLKVVLIAADTQRLGAYEQLQQVAKDVGADFFGIYNEKDSVKIVSQALEKFSNYDVKIIDTSGRSALNQDLLNEIKRLGEISKPDEVILVLDASTGQQAGKQAAAFNNAIKITGVFLTKLDGTAKGGGALSAVASTGAPILFIGTGEHMDDMEYFNPARFLSRLLGMGDLETLMATAKELREGIEEESIERMASGKFTLKDMYDVWEKMSKPGIFKKLFDSLPMFKIQQKEIDESIIDQSESKIRKYKIIMDSMTFQELEEPDLIKGERIERIAKGSGTETSDVKELLKDFKRMRDAMKNLRGNRKIISMLKKQLKEGNIPELNQ